MTAPLMTVWCDGLAALPFRAVNRPGVPSYRPGLQRHHLLPRQLLAVRGFRGMFDELGVARGSIHDFRRNGLLLPACEADAMRIGLPLHRGPHAGYNAMVIERVGAIESEWSRTRGRRRTNRAEHGALLALDALQKALRRELLDPACRQARPLNRHDPALDYSHLDAMAEMLWGATEPAF